MSHPVYLKPNVIVEPLFNQWYAWSYLVSPATAALYVKNSHIPIMESFVAAPQVHQATLKNPEMRGGPFIHYAPDRAPEIQALCQQTQSEQQQLLTLAKAIQDLGQILKDANGSSLEPLYEQVPAALKGYVELVYDQNHQASMRFIEGLLYRSAYYDDTRQSIALSLAEVDARSFVLSTPRLRDRQSIHLQIPFKHTALDRLSQMRQTPRPYAQICDELGVATQDEPLFSQFFTDVAPVTAAAYQGESVRVRYFGHACVLVETDQVAILCDPLVAYPSSNGLPRYSYDDLPDRIDYALITHNHQDHVMLETLLQLRHKIQTVVVPKSNSGTLLDPSLKQILQVIGFTNVRELDELDTIEVPDGSITGLPFLGEHGDLNIAAKIAYFIQLKGRSLLCAADSNNIEPKLYEHIYHLLGAIDVLFIGMECEGAPYTWAYGALLTHPVSRQQAQTRRLDGSNADRAIALVQQLRPQHAYVYAMGQEPWLTFITSIAYTPDAKPILESDRFVAYCQQSGIHSQRLFGRAELFLEPRSPLNKRETNIKVPTPHSPPPTSSPTPTPHSLPDFLAQLQQLDIKLWLDRGPDEQKPEPTLRCNAPKGVLTPALQAQLKQRKPEIIQFLSHDTITQQQRQLQAEITLDPAIAPHAVLAQPHSPPQHIFLTGATGFVGAFLLHELLQQTNAHIFCLVRADHLEQAKHRIQQNLVTYHLANAANRITPLLGDLSQPQLGLSDSQFQSLADQVDAIYHNGAWVNHTLPYTTLKAANVLGTQEVLRLATQRTLKPVHLISTISVFGADTSSLNASTLISEQADLEDFPMPVMGYAQSKRIAEGIGRIGHDRGIPICVYRLGAVSGSSQTGVFNRNDFLYRLIVGCVQLGSVPDRPMLLDMLPVDYVSRAIVALSQQPSTIGQTFHLVHPQPVTSEIIFEFLQSRGYAVKQMNYSQWRDQLLAVAQADPNHVLYPLLTLLPTRDRPTADDVNHSPRYATDNTQQYLHSAGLKCPAINHHLLEVYLTYLIQSEILEPPDDDASHTSTPPPLAPPLAKGRLGGV
jgi:thioester reductase-like protein